MLPAHPTCHVTLNWSEKGFVEFLVMGAFWWMTITPAACDKGNHMLKRTLVVLAQASRPAAAAGSTSAGGAATSSGAGMMSSSVGPAVVMGKTSKKIATGSALGAVGSRILTAHLARNSMPGSLRRTTQPHKTLYELLSTLPNDGVGFKVRQRRWEARGVDHPSSANPAHDDLHQHIADVQHQRQLHKQAVLAAKQTDAAATDATGGRATTIAPPLKSVALAHPHSYCFWEVTKVDLTSGGKSGEAWGKLTWRGKARLPTPLESVLAVLTLFVLSTPGQLKNETPKRIPGALKYCWDLAR